MGKLKQQEENQLYFDFFFDVPKPVYNFIDVFENPKNDNERFMNFQKDYLETGNPDAWNGMWKCAVNICTNLIKLEKKRTKTFISDEDTEDISLNAVCYVLRRFKTTPGYYIKTNSVKALQGGVLHAMKHRNKSEIIYNSLQGIDGRIEDLPEYLALTKKETEKGEIK